MHNEDGSKTSQPYGQKNEHIFSMGREMLNKKLLNKGSENPNIEYHFETKLTYRDVDLKKSNLSVAIKGGEKKKVGLVGGEVCMCLVSWCSEICSDDWVYYNDA